MKECKFIVALLIISLLIPTVSAQRGQVDVRSMSAKKLKLYGKNADHLGDVYSAIDFLDIQCLNNFCF